MKPIVSWTLRQRRWFIGWWIVGIVAFIVLQMAFYPTIRDQAAELEKSFSKLSDSAVALFSDTGDFFSPVGYLSGQIFYLMLPLLLGALAIGLGASLIGREEKEGTIELLLSRPISRSKLIGAKAFVGVLIVVGVGAVAVLLTAAMAKIVDIPVAFSNILLAGLNSVILAVSFGAVAFMVATLGRGARAASIGAASLIALAGYLLASLASTIEWLKWPAKFFPFNYYHPAEVLRGTYSSFDTLVVVGLIIICAFVSWIAFRRRDIGSQ